MPADIRPSLETFDETSRPLVETLRSDRPSAREVAIQEISEVVDDALARELLRFARDSNVPEEERATALIALGPTLQMCWEDEDDEGMLPPPPPNPSAFEEAFFDHPLSNEAYSEVQEALRRVYHDAGAPKLLRRRALEAAVRAPRDWHRDAAAAAWRSDDPEWRLTAVFTMGQLGGMAGGPFEEEIRTALGDSDERLRREAMLAAGRAGLEELAPELMDVAGRTDVDREDRLAAIEALGEMMPDGASEVLRSLLDDPDREVAMMAEEALEDILLFSDADLDLDFDPDDDPDLSVI